MNERDQLIEKLVTTMHLNVPERAALSTDSVRYSEVAAVLERVLEDTGYFECQCSLFDGLPYKEVIELALPIH